MKPIFCVSQALSGLPPKQYNGTLEPYVALNIIKQSWSHRKRQKLHSFRTRSIRHTANPIYKETFAIANIKPQEAKVDNSNKNSQKFRKSYIF